MEDARQVLDRGAIIRTPPGSPRWQEWQKDAKRTWRMEKLAADEFFIYSVGPDDAVSAYRGSLTDFIWANRMYLAEKGRVDIEIGPDFGLEDLKLWTIAATRSRAFRRRWHLFLMQTWEEPEPDKFVLKRWLVVEEDLPRPC